VTVNIFAALMLAHGQYGWHGDRRDANLRTMLEQSTTSLTSAHF
jgi:hypothetical protein